MAGRLRSLKASATHEAQEVFHSVMHALGSPGQIARLVRRCTDQELLTPLQLQGLPEAVVVQARALQPDRPSALLPTLRPPQRFQSRLPSPPPPPPLPAVLLGLHLYSKAKFHG